MAHLAPFAANARLNVSRPSPAGFSGDVSNYDVPHFDMPLHKFFKLVRTVRTAKAFDLDSHWGNVTSVLEYVKFFGKFPSSN